MSDLNAKDAAVQVSALISCLGADGIQVMNTLPFKCDADRQKVDKILKLLDEHFIGQENVSYKRFKFYSWTQALDETVEILTLICECFRKHAHLSRMAKILPIK